MELTRKIHIDFNGHVFIGEIVSDDDSILRKNLRHVNHDGGSLEEEIPDHVSLDNSSHRIKAMTAPIYKMVSDTMDPRWCKKNDANRSKKYCSCYIYQNRHLPLAEFVCRSKAPVEHIFNNHEWCYRGWCWAKDIDENTMEMFTTMIKILPDPTIRDQSAHQ